MELLGLLGFPQDSRFGIRARAARSRKKVDRVPTLVGSDAVGWRIMGNILEAIFPQNLGVPSIGDVSAIVVILYLLNTALGAVIHGA